MKNRIAILLTALALLQIYGIACAQKMEAPKNREPGDRAVFNVTVNGKTQVMEENWIGLTDDEMVGMQKYAGKEFAVVVSKSPEYQLRKLPCYGGPQQCSYSPGLQYINFPLEKGKKWTVATTVAGETFTAELTQERVVERIETVRTPAGEFEVYKVAFSGRVRGKDSKGLPFSEREEGANWFALVSGKMITVKTEFKSSSGTRLAIELISASFK